MWQTTSGHAAKGSFMQEIQITIIQPERYRHSEGFREIAETLQYGFRSLGCTACIRENTFDPRAMNILLGAHLLTQSQAAAVPPGSILYNLEQLGGANLPGLFFELASRYQVWDYSALNVEQWKSMPCAFQPLHVEVGYVPELRRIASAAEQDIDVLFYGSVNARRRKILEAIQSTRVKLHYAFGVYGKERDELIARSKIVLNVHFYETQMFEAVRVSYLLTNAKAVVTEISPDLGNFRDAVAAFPYDTLVEGCLMLLSDEQQRKELEIRGFERFSLKSEPQILNKVTPMQLCGSSTGISRKLNLGSGKDWREDYFNVDVNAYWQPDAVLDFSQPLPFGEFLQTQRFGAVTLREDFFEEIIANDVLEHIPDLIQGMTSCLRLLKEGGLFRIQVPYDLSWGAWQDPTHLRAFNERSWLYYTDWFWYLGWTEARFELAHIEYGLSPVGEELKQKIEAGALLRQPRAVDFMRVVLRKRFLAAEEKQKVVAYMKRPQRGPVAPATPFFAQEEMATEGRR